MTGRMRKLLGGIGIVAFVIGYAIGMAAVAGRLPNQALVRLAFFAVAGLGWGAPLIPLISWMNRGR